MRHRGNSHRKRIQEHSWNGLYPFQRERTARDNGSKEYVTASRVAAQQQGPGCLDHSIQGYPLGTNIFLQAAGYVASHAKMARLIGAGRFSLLVRNRLS